MTDTPDDPEKRKEELQTIFYMMLLAILFLKLLIEAYFEKNVPAFGHNTGIIVIVGILASFTLFKVTDADDKEFL